MIYDDQTKEGQKEAAYKMHRVIQEVLQKKLAPEYADLETLIKGISAKLKIDQTKDNPIDKFPYVPFGQRILQIVPQSEESEYATFENNLAGVLRALGDYTGAKELFEKAYHISKSKLGENHPNTKIFKQWLDSMNNV